MGPLARWPWGMPFRHLLWLALVLLPTGQTQSSSWHFARLSAEHPGCYYMNFKFHPEIPHTSVKASSVRQCQALCRRMEGCAKFSYWSDERNCHFAEDKAELQRSEGAVAGLGVCPQGTGAESEQCRRDLPGNGFPGLSAEASNAAWPSGKQPQTLECWPRNATGGYMSCKQTTILEDTVQGWPGKCHALVKQNGTFSQCAERCQQNPLCPSWQTGMKGCWTGLGYNCFVREDFTPIKAQRIQHGYVRVLWNLTGWQVVGLAKSFDNKPGYFLKQQDAIEACKKVCYSDIRCQYWQYTPKYGCWVEDASKSFHPPWPLTTQWAYRSTTFALDCVAGEYIQHICPDGMAVPFVEVKEHLAWCMSVGYDYDPPDMRWEGMTVEMSAETCQERCKSTRGCQTFSYWPNGDCHLQDEDSVRVRAEDARVISGPGVCGQATTARPKEVTPPPVIVTKAPTEQESTGAVKITVAEIMVQIINLKWSVLAKDIRGPMKIKFAEILAQHLHVKPEDIRNRPKVSRGTPRWVLVRDVGGTDISISPTNLEGPQQESAGSLVVAYTDIPDDNVSIGRIYQVVHTRSFKKDVILGFHEAYANHSLNATQKHGTLTEMRANHTKYIHIGQCKVNKLQGWKKGTQKGSNNEGCGLVCQLWPLAVGLLLLIVAIVVTLGVWFLSKKNKKKKKRAAKNLALVEAESAQDSAVWPAQETDVSLNTRQEMTPFLVNSERSMASSLLRPGETRPLRPGEFEA